jgi:tRNA(Ile)-lysidine synthase
MAKSLSNKISEHLSELLSNHFEDRSLFVIGVSGGPDSMALMYLFHMLNQDALIVHINYGKRGKQSDKDQELVEQMAFQWRFECCTVNLDPKDAKGENFQNWAREQRYDFFRGLMHDAKAEAIVTAHHQDDQVETILQKIFRGSSPEAWQGMKPWNGELFRPLLPFSKQHILDFCTEEAIPFRIDKSNKSPEFARNFIRNEFSEKMDSLFPGWKSNIINLSEYGKTLEASSQYIADQVTSGNSILLPAFSKLPVVLKPAILKTILDQSGLKGTYSRGLLKELAAIESLQTGKSLKAGNLLLTKARDHIHIHPDDPQSPIHESISKSEAEKGFKVNDISIQLEKQPADLPSLRLDAESLQWPLSVRNWSSGDSFQPLGLSGSQKISDHLTNRKIPVISREKALVLCGSDGTIYAIIYPSRANNDERGAISELAKCKPHSITFLTINFS